MRMGGRGEREDGGAGRGGGGGDGDGEMKIKGKGEETGGPRCGEQRVRALCFMLQGRVPMTP